MPRADVAGRSAVIYVASSRARSAMIASRSISVIRASRSLAWVSWPIVPRCSAANQSRGRVRGNHGPFFVSLVFLQNPKFYGDVAPGRAGVRADLVGRLRELADLLAFHPGDV